MNLNTDSLTEEDVHKLITEMLVDLNKKVDSFTNLTKNDVDKLITQKLS